MSGECNICGGMHAELTHNLKDLIFWKLTYEFEIYDSRVRERVITKKRLKQISKGIAELVKEKYAK